MPSDWRLYLEQLKILYVHRQAASSAFLLRQRLRGDRRGQYSIRINSQWRICFEWPQGAAGPSEVEIVDYH
jgi:plasmid maintenance system killer protein